MCAGCFERGRTCGGRAEGIVEGREEGIAEGMKKNAIAVAKTMKLDNIPLETIAKYTGLSVEDLAAI